MTENTSERGFAGVDIAKHSLDLHIEGQPVLHLAYDDAGVQAACSRLREAMSAALMDRYATNLHGVTANLPWISRMDIDDITFDHAHPSGEPATHPLTRPGGRLALLLGLAGPGMRRRRAS